MVEKVGSTEGREKESRIKKLLALLAGLVALGVAIDRFNSDAPDHPNADDDARSSETNHDDLHRDIERAVAEITPEQQQDLREGIAAVQDALRESEEAKSKKADFQKKAFPILRDFLAHIDTEGIEKDVRNAERTAEAKEAYTHELLEYLKDVTVEESGDEIQVLVDGNMLLSYQFVMDDNGAVDVKITEYGRGGFGAGFADKPPGMVWMMNDDFDTFWEVTGRAALLNTLDMERLMEKHAE